MRDNYLDEEFMSDEEIEEALDAFVDAIAEQTQDGCTVSAVNPIKRKMVMAAYKVLKYATKGSSAKVTYELHKPYVSMGSVTVEGKELKFDKPEWITAVAKIASNVDIYPTASGKIRLEFTFHGLTTSVK